MKGWQRASEGKKKKKNARERMPCYHGAMREAWRVKPISTGNADRVESDPGLYNRKAKCVCG